MKNFAIQLEGLVATLNSVESTVKAFQALRDFCSDEQWDEFTSAGPLGDLLDTLSDLECDFEKE